MRSLLRRLWERYKAHRWEVRESKRRLDQKRLKAQALHPGDHGHF